MMKRSIKKGDEGEQIVINTLLEMNDEQYLINNLILLGDNDVSHQFDHILIRHNGIFVIETKNYYGEISGSVDDTYWFKRFKFHNRPMIKKFINPIKQNNAHIRYLKKIIGRNIPIINFVVFVNNDVSKLNIYTVCNIDTLNQRIQSIDEGITLNSETMQLIEKTLLRMEADIQSEDHVKRINTLKKERRDIRKESILVMEKGICPVCGNKITMNKNIYFCNKCNYKLIV